MSQVVGLLNNSYNPITNTAWVRARLCKLQKECTRLAAASDKAYQLLAHGWWFSLGTLGSSTTKTGHHAIAEILLKLKIKPNQITFNKGRKLIYWTSFLKIHHQQTTQVKKKFNWMNAEMVN